ncbi:MAG TPA: TolC family protein [Terriglobia bacterium]|nr:TolC family protein [Terriglobia bacterium]
MKKRIILLTCSAVLWLSREAAAQQQPLRLSLQSVVDTYIQNNLDLQAARYRLERVKADQIAARVRPNPALSVSAENLAVSGPTPFSRLYEVGAVYTETFELGGKRELRTRAANATVTAAEAQFEDTMRRGVADVKRLYLDALLARYNVDVARENRQTFDELVQFNQTRFQEGAIPEVELIKVRLERVKFDSNAKQAEVGFRLATIRLLEKLATSVSSAAEIAGDLEFRGLTLDITALRQSALNDRSDIRLANAEVTAARERLALERGRAKPDISPFAGYKRVGSDNTLLFGVNVPLKIRDKNEGEISRADTDLKIAEARLQLARNHALAEVESVYAGLQAARDLVETFQNELLKQADESRDITVSAYEEGGIELLPVLEAQRTRSEVRHAYFKTLFDYQASLVALELAVGREIQP